jgi:hypothetical protein
MMAGEFNSKTLSTFLVHVSVQKVSLESRPMYYSTCNATCMHRPIIGHPSIYLCWCRLQYVKVVKHAYESTHLCFVCRFSNI